MARPSGRRTSQFPLGKAQPAPSVPSLDNDFRGGLKTEFTGLNFPENACTATSNCVFTRTGNVQRRGGINPELNAVLAGINRTNSAISSFVWTNAGGTGNGTIYVLQVSGTLFFYLISNATTSTSFSSTKLSSIVNFGIFTAFQGTFDGTQECQFASGNGYLFVFHPNCDPFYCVFTPGTNTVTASIIQIATRDFVGVPTDTFPDGFRPNSQSITPEHNYNIYNQGWTSGGTLVTTSSTTTNQFQTGPLAFQIPAGLSFSIGDTVIFNSPNPIGSMTGVVTSYSGTTLTVNILVQNGPAPPANSSSWNIVKGNTGLINQFFAASGNLYPSNADIWYTFKNSTGVFDPATTLVNTQLLNAPAPKGHFIFSNTFLQQRTLVSGQQGLTDIITTARPKTGAWFQGRVWYSGVDGSFSATGDAPYTTWSENIYFSQIVITPTQFGRCYQTNDPTAEILNALLPSDGGVVQIQGCGTIYKLFPIVNGILVFAANGIWFITGNTGIGFTANDFTVTKISGEHAISGTSFVDVQGYPIFWNADGIYSVAPGQSLTSGQRALEVKNLTLETIKQFYQSIPLSSKLYARGSYNHITGVIQWAYKNIPEVSVTTRYNFDSILNLLTYTGAFYPWSIGSGSNIHDVNYFELVSTSPTTTPVPGFRYISSTPSGNSYTFTFSQEIDFTQYEDFGSSFVSSFTTGYRLKGQALKKFQPEYVYIFSEQPTSQYTIQGIWNYATSGQSGKFSSVQVVNNNKQLFSKTFNRVRIRGQGYVLQFKISSSANNPFNIAGWSVLDQIGVGV